MRLFGYELTVKAVQPPLRPLSPAPWWDRSSGAWWPVIREPYTGAWQQNQDIAADTALAYFAVFACVTLIASDVAKLRLRLVEQDAEGIWTETTNPAYSPVLRKPNRYQTIIKFLERWIISKLVAGNTYVLKERDGRGVVVALYVLDPARVTPLVAPDGGVYYRLDRDDLASVPEFSDDGGGVVVPASEIIHDLMCPIFHPLCGVSPLFAAGLSALQGRTIQSASNAFFANGSRPGGILSAPGKISDETAQRLKDYFEANFGGSNSGRVAALGDGLKYDPLTYNAVDSQLIDQLKWTGETICSCYHTPPFLIGLGPPPPYANFGPVIQQYYATCIQPLVASLELALDEGLEFPRPTIGTELDITDLYWMDMETRTKAAGDAVANTVMSPNEARRLYFGLGSVKGGESPMAQQQYYSLEALAERDASKPFVQAAPVTPPGPPNEDDEPEDDDEEPDEDEDEGKDARLPERRELPRDALHGALLRLTTRALEAHP